MDREIRRTWGSHWRVLPNITPKTREKSSGKYFAIMVGEGGEYKTKLFNKHTGGVITHFHDKMRAGKLWVAETLSEIKP